MYTLKQFPLVVVNKMIFKCEKFFKNMNSQLPMEIIINIMTYCDPISFIKFSRSSKFMYQNFFLNDTFSSQYIKDRINSDTIMYTASLKACYAQNLQIATVLLHVYLTVEKFKQVMVNILPVQYKTNYHFDNSTDLIIRTKEDYFPTEHNICVIRCFHYFIKRKYDWNIYIYDSVNKIYIDLLTDISTLNNKNEYFFIATIQPMFKNIDNL